MYSNAKRRKTKSSIEVVWKSYFHGCNYGSKLRNSILEAMKWQKLETLSWLWCDDTAGYPWAIKPVWPNKNVLTTDFLWYWRLDCTKYPKFKIRQRGKRYPVTMSSNSKNAKEANKLISFIKEAYIIFSKTSSTKQSSKSVFSISSNQNF